jgi:DNA-binding GntR family transcriptional regulator
VSIQAEPEIKLHPLRQGANMPLWLQLKHALRDLVTFNLRPGDRIPSESQICSFYNLSRITVRQAVTSLVDEGLLDRQQGRGTYVLSPRLVLPLADPEHFLLSGFDASDPDNITVFSKEIVQAADWFGVPLGLANDEPVYKVRKVLRIDNDAVAFRTSFVPCHLTPDLLDADLSPPLALVLEKNYHLVASEADEVIEFIIADEFRGGMLGVPEGHPLILVSRLVFLESRQPLELSRTYYKADRFRFERHLTR